LTEDTFSINPLSFMILIIFNSINILLEFRIEESMVYGSGWIQTLKEDMFITIEGVIKVIVSVIDKEVNRVLGLTLECLKWKSKNAFISSWYLLLFSHMKR
jgi:hypothetical protein